MNIPNLGKGYLTYALALVGVIYGVGAYLAGQIDAETATKIVYGALIVFGIRRAVK